jgi:hypothetical protein
MGIACSRAFVDVTIRFAKRVPTRWKTTLGERPVERQFHPRAQSTRAADRGVHAPSGASM